MAALFLAPAMALLLGFVVIPTIWALWISVTSYSLLGPGANKHTFVGMANYKRLLTDPLFYASAQRTAIFVIASAIIGQFVLGLAAALALHRRDIPLRGLFGAAIILPLAVPEVVAGLMWAAMLEPEQLGTLNRIIGLFGAAPIAWIAFGRVAGFLLFTLSEYILHRWLYHRIPGFVRDLHNIHHVDPLRLIATPWFLTSSIAMGLYGN